MITSRRTWAFLSRYLIIGVFVDWPRQPRQKLQHTNLVSSLLVTLCGIHTNKRYILNKYLLAGSSNCVFSSSIITFTWKSIPWQTLACPAAVMQLGDILVQVSWLKSREDLRFCRVWKRDESYDSKSAMGEAGDPLYLGRGDIFIFICKTPPWIEIVDKSILILSVPIVSRKILYHMVRMYLVSTDVPTLVTINNKTWFATTWWTLLCW